MAATPDMLMGSLVHTSAFMPAVAAGAKSFLFGDLSYYCVADRQRRSFRRLGELYAPTGQAGFLATQRVDGKLVLAETLAVKNAEMSIDGYKAGLVKDTSYKGLWKVSFTLKEFKKGNAF